YLDNLRSMSIRAVVETAKDLLDTTVFAWFVKPYNLFASADYSDLAFALLIGVLVVGLVVIYLFLLKKGRNADPNATPAPRPIAHFVLLGAFSVLCAVTPVVVSGRDVDLGDPYKSYGLHPIGGVVILIAGLVLMLRPRFRWL